MHVLTLPIECYRNDCLRILACYSLPVNDCLLEKFRIHVPCFSLRAHENRLGTKVGNRMRGCAEGVALHKHLVISRHSAADKCEVHRRSSSGQAYYLAVKRLAAISLPIGKCLSRSFSNAFTLGPIGTTQFVSKASLKCFCS